MQDLNTIWSSCIETLEKNNIVEDKILLESIFENATLESIDDNHVIITTDFRWNIETILEKKKETPNKYPRKPGMPNKKPL